MHGPNSTVYFSYHAEIKLTHSLYKACHIICFLTAAENVKLNYGIDIPPPTDV